MAAPAEHDYGCIEALGTAENRIDRGFVHHDCLRRGPALRERAPGCICDSLEAALEAQSRQKKGQNSQASFWAEEARFQPNAEPQTTR